MIVNTMIVCGAGKYSENVAQTSDTCSDCPVGRFGVSCEDCPVGRYRTADSTNVTQHDQLNDCTICGAGKYSENTAQTSDTCHDSA